MTHPFAHIMDGPYTVIGYEDAVSLSDSLLLKAGNGGIDFDLPKEGDCIGSCDHCHTAISYAVKIRGAKGVFKVGETCAGKIDGEVSKVAKVYGNARRKRQKNAKIEAEYQINLKWMEETPELKTKPHPKGFNNLSLYDAVLWYRQNAGKAKFNEYCKAHK